MKTHCLLILILAFTCIQSKAQGHEVATNEIIFKDQLINDGVFVQVSVRTPGFPLMQGSDSPAIYKDEYYLQKSRIQTIDGLVLMTGGSLISAWGTRNVFSGACFTNKLPLATNFKYENLSATRLALTGLVMVAGSVPYFIKALKNRQKGLSLRCQKTSYGSLNTARKKVTGITFSIPIGK